jgi:hypothetical protein
MEFNLFEKPKSFHCEVSGETEGARFHILAEFKAFGSDEEIEDVMARIEELQTDGGSSREITTTIYEIADELFIGWVNPVDQPHLQMRSGGELVECTDEYRTLFLKRPGVSFQIMMAYQRQRFEAKSGNFESSRGNGSKAPFQPRKTART